MTKITPKEIIDHLVSTNPNFANLKSRQSTAVLRESLRLISNAIENTNNDVVRIAGLGTFRTKTVEREKEGAKTVIKRFVFRPIKKRQNQGSTGSPEQASPEALDKG
ncbi:MAG: hypothetical protein ACPHYF_06835 [Akkermansiaceae bacterium]